MSPNFFEFFKLSEAFTKEDLDKAYFRKLKNVESLNISIADKDLYRKEVKKTYKKAIKYINEFSIDPINTMEPKKEPEFIKHVYYNLSSVSNDLLNESNLYSDYEEKSKIIKKVISKPVKKNDLIKNIFDLNNQITDGIDWYESRKGFLHSIEKSYSKILNPDNSYTIREKSIINNNGKIEKKEKKYKKYSNGEIFII
jgi:hypothetical protein